MALDQFTPSEVTRTPAQRQRAYRERLRSGGARTVDVILRPEADAVLRRLCLETGETPENVLRILLGHPSAPAMLSEIHG